MPICSIACNNLDRSIKSYALLMSNYNKYKGILVIFTAGNATDVFSNAVYTERLGQNAC